MSDFYQGIVFSGGGAKGPFALGVMLAMQKFNSERGRKIHNFYCGTSVGALNAALAAQGNLDKLRDLYQTLRTQDILGTASTKISGYRLWRKAGKAPFHYFESTALRKTIEKHVSFEAVKEAHLLICATNYLSGELETFYTSSLVDKFIEIDNKLPLEKRRLIGYHRINNQEELVEALLASAAIPFFFPPVNARGSIYIDGGIGNNTPLRQAAYFCRFLNKEGIGKIEPIICVLNDPARFAIENSDAKIDVAGVIKRTIDIFQEELVRDSMTAWERISKEVVHTDDKAVQLDEFFDSMPELSADKRAEVKAKVREVLGASTAATPRLNLEALFIRPSSALIDDILSFEPQKAKDLKHRGVADCLSTLFHRRLINSDEQRRWVGEIA